MKFNNYVYLYLFPNTNEAYVIKGPTSTSIPLSVTNIRILVVRKTVAANSRPAVTLKFIKNVDKKRNTVLRKTTSQMIHFNLLKMR